MQTSLKTINDTPLFGFSREQRILSMNELLFDKIRLFIIQMNVQKLKGIIKVKMQDKRGIKKPPR